MEQLKLSMSTYETSEKVKFKIKCVNQSPITLEENLPKNAKIFTLRENQKYYTAEINSVGDFVVVIKKWKNTYRDNLLLRKHMIFDRFDEVLENKEYIMYMIIKLCLNK